MGTDVRSKAPTYLVTGWVSLRSTSVLSKRTSVPMYIQTNQPSRGRKITTKGSQLYAANIIMTRGIKAERFGAPGQLGSDFEKKISFPLSLSFPLFIFLGGIEKS